VLVDIAAAAPPDSVARVDTRPRAATVACPRPNDPHSPVLTLHGALHHTQPFERTCVNTRTPRPKAINTHTHIHTYTHTHTQTQTQTHTDTDTHTHTHTHTHTYSAHTNDIMHTRHSPHTFIPTSGLSTLVCTEHAFGNVGRGLSGSRVRKMV
jgi:hypothetical protein